MPLDSLFPPVAGVSRVVTLSADRAFAADLLGTMVVLNGKILTLSAVSGAGFCILLGAGSLAGDISQELSATQAVMLALSGGGFKAIDQPLADIATALAHISNTANPHGVTKAQVGLSNVDNTSDANKPVSTAQATAIATAATAAGLNSGKPHNHYILSDFAGANNDIEMDLVEVVTSLEIIALTSPTVTTSTAVIADGVLTVNIGSPGGGVAGEMTALQFIELVGGVIGSTSSVRNKTGNTGAGSIVPGTYELSSPTSAPPLLRADGGNLYFYSSGFWQKADGSPI